MRIETDQRSLPADPRPEIHRRLVEGRLDWLRREIRRAQDFDEICVSGHYRLENCATVTEYGEKLGYDARQVRRWRNIGLSLRVEPRLLDAVLSSNLSLEKVEILAPIYRMPERRFEGDDWMRLANVCSPRDLRRHVQRRIEEVRHGKTCQSRTITAPDDVWNDFARARDVGSSLAGRALTQGETLGAALSEYLDRKDPLRKAERANTRRKPAPPHEQKRKKASGSREKRRRRAQADLVHQLWLRAGGECEYPGCRCRRGLQVAHIHPHASGGPLDIRNLVLLCRTHHTLFDAERLQFLGWGEDGSPRFDVDVSRPRPPPS